MTRKHRIAAAALSAFVIGSEVRHMEALQAFEVVRGGTPTAATFAELFANTLFVSWGGLPLGGEDATVRVIDDFLAVCWQETPEADEVPSRATDHLWDELAQAVGIPPALPPPQEQRALNATLFRTRCS